MRTFLVHALVAWVGLAFVGAFAHVLGVTLMVPMVTAALLAHLAFRDEGSYLQGLGVALMLGLIADAAEGGVFGSGALAHQLAFMLLRRASKRVAVSGVLGVMTLSALACLLVVTAQFCVLLPLAGALRIEAWTLARAWTAVPYSALATAAIAPPIWGAVSRLVRAQLGPGLGRRAPIAGARS